MTDAKTEAKVCGEQNICISQSITSMIFTNYKENSNILQCGKYHLIQMIKSWLCVCVYVCVYKHTKLLEYYFNIF